MIRTVILLAAYGWLGAGVVWVWYWIPKDDGEPGWFYADCPDWEPDFPNPATEAAIVWIGWPMLMAAAIALGVPYWIGKRLVAWIERGKEQAKEGARK